MMSNYPKIIKDQSGFTLIELMVATTLFSIVLVVIVASFLQVGRMFYKGVSIDNTNESARTLVDDVANDIRLSGYFDPGNTLVTPAPATQYFCVGPHRYTFKLRTQVKDTDISSTAQTMQGGIIQDSTNQNCQDPSTLTGTDPSQILGPDMRLNALDVVANAANTSIRVHTHIIFYGADDSVFSSVSHPNNTDTDHAAAINDADAYCSGNLLSTQFCAMADISTNVTRGY
jgi:prepilin-type N-terminal cleavage/methylation domain-containing protein